MKIILSTYNYYPVHKGGTEVYTKALAEYLQQHGHEVLIIAAGDEKGAPEDCSVLLDNEAAKAVAYSYEGVQVWGVDLKQQSIDDIYRGYNKVWEDHFSDLLSQKGWSDTSLLILNGFSTVSGLSLCKAIRRLNPLTAIEVIVHTPFICPKADMIYSKDKGRCRVVMSAKTCAACYLSAHTKLPYFISASLMGLIEMTNLSRVVKATPVRLPDLLRMKFAAFRELDELTSRWTVFAEDMQQFMVRQPFIAAGKIRVIRHGIDKAIFFKGHATTSNIISFLYAGRFEEIKGVGLLVNAWLQLPDEPHVRRLLLAGNWQTSTLGQKARRLLGERNDVTFLANMPQNELADLYRKTDCVIIPSRWVETGPMVFHEAIACGCDVISSDIGGQGELVEVYEEKATSFQSGNANSLRDAIAAYRPSGRSDRYTPYSLAEHFDYLLSTTVTATVQKEVDGV